MTQFRSMSAPVLVFCVLLMLADGGAAPGESGFQEIWVFPEIHQDIGFTDTYDRTLEDMANCLDAVVPFLEANPEATFWWENVYTLEIALERRAHLFDRTKALIQEGRFGVGATYSGIDATATPAESIVRTMTHAKWWMLETFGVEPKVATLIDMSGFPPQMPQILRKSGVDLLIYTRAYGAPRRPFGCLALDGSGLPACFVEEGYDYFGFMDDAGEPDLAQMEKKLSELNPEQWSGNILWGFNCGGGDNDTPDLYRIRTYIDRWHETHPDGPLLRFGLPSELPELFQPGETETPFSTQPWILFGQTWPVIKREGPTFRAFSQAERALFTAESLAVFLRTLRLAEISPRETEEIWDDFLWAYEHNWGGRGGGGSDRAKLAAARKATQHAEELETRYLKTLAGAIRCASRTVVVFNPLGWPRSGVVEVSLERDGVIVGEDDVPVPAWHQAGDGGAVVARFVARDVPAFGYRTFRVAGKGVVLPAARLSWNEDINLLLARMSGTELQLIRSENNQPVTHANPVSFGHMISTDTRVGGGRIDGQGNDDGPFLSDSLPLSSDSLGDLGWRFTLRGEIESSPYTTTLSCVPQIDTWEIECEIDYVGVAYRCVFLPLPFDPRFSEVELGTPFGSWVSPQESHRADFEGLLAGDTFSPHTRNAQGHIGGWKAQATPWRYYEKWFDLRDPETGEGILVASREGNNAFYRDEEGLAVGLIQTPMFHDAWPRKTGIHRYRWAFRYHPARLSNLEAARFGWETATPLVGAVVGPQPDGRLPPVGRFLGVDGDVIVTALKPAHDGDGAVIRLYVPQPDEKQFTIAGQGRVRLRSLMECDLLERPVQSQPQKGNVLGAKLGGYGIGTYRLGIARR